MTVEDYFGDWIKVINKKELNIILNKLSKEYNTKIICPNQGNVFKAFKLCPYKDLKIVFVGQDPYPQKGVSTGILFGNKKEVDDNHLSPSLQIIKEAVINYEIPHNNIIFDNTLESWAKQGILMLNSALTVEMNKIGSHVMLWRPFIAKLLKNLSNKEPGIIYVLFGSQAQTFIPYINIRNSIVVKTEHPAWYARTNQKMSPKLFLDINKVLKEKYGVPIEWYKEY